MQIAIVILVVVAAAVYLGRTFYKNIRQSDGCSCGCSGCGVSDACREKASGCNDDCKMDPTRR